MPESKDGMSDRTLHMIGNGHIDPVWLWQWQEGVQEVLATFRSALDRMEEDADFRFTASSAAFYAWVERIDPEMFAEIQQRVAEGRWEIIGGWWIEPDCNIPGGESFVRQALYGQRYVQEAFGTIVRVGYNVDSFGHHGVLPQILKKSGLDAYVFMRPGPHEKGLPGRLFWWEARDGSRVLTYRLPFQYASWSDDLKDHVRRCAAEMKPPIDELACFYGVGNHGGGPTIENIQSIHQLNDDPALPRLVFSTLDTFFDTVRHKDWPLPIVHDDLQHHASGCYSAHAGIKQWNRQAENALLRAEAWATITTQATGRPYPQAALTQAWHDVLFNQFHDILAGTSLKVAYDDARYRYGEALTIADRALTEAIQSLAWAMQIPQEQGVKPIVVFNPHPWPCRTGIELEVGRLSEAAALTDDAGASVTFQRVRSHATAGGRARIVFTAELPPLGYRLYRLCAEGTTAEGAPGGAGASELDNERFRLTFDPDTGYLTGLYDKVSEIEILGGPAARPVVIHDPSDTWSHGVLRFDDEVGEFKATNLRVMENGPVKSVLRVESEWGDSSITQEFTLYAELDVIDVHVTIDWHEHFKMLKLRFPVNARAFRAAHEIPYGHIERPADGVEYPIQRWIDISGTAGGVPYGFALINDSKPSVDVTLTDHGPEIGMTVLRSPVYAHHTPTEIAPDQAYEFMDQGRHTFTYRLYPHRGSWEDAGVVQRAAELNQQPVTLIATARPGGTLPTSASYISVEPSNVVVTVLKPAEDGDDPSETLILRAYETTGTGTEGLIRLTQWNRVIQTTFLPGEIKTFRVPRDPSEPMEEVNLLEQ